MSWHRKANNRAALDAGRALCLHIWRYWPGASEREHQSDMTKKKGPWIIGVCVAAAFWCLLHTPEIQWYAAKLYVGKRVTVIGPVIGGTLDAPDGVVTMTMGTELSSNAWQS